MRKIVWKVIVIELFSSGGFPLGDAVEHFFLRIKVSFLVLLYLKFHYSIDIY
jgi:hypothetical protein